MMLEANTSSAVRLVVRELAARAREVSRAAARRLTGGDALGVKPCVWLDTVPVEHPSAVPLRAEQPESRARHVIDRVRTELSPELNGLLREGLLSDLQEQGSAVGECRGDRVYVRCGVVDAIERAGGTAAVLDVIGWSAEDEDPDSVLDGDVHRDALLRGLRVAITTERETQENPDTVAACARARNRAGRLLGLLKTVEGAG